MRFARRLPLLALFLCAHVTRAADARIEGRPYVQIVPGAPDVSFKMMPIPAGKLLMGSPASEPHRTADEGPQFTVEIDAFWIGQTVVTQAEFQLFMDGRARLAERATPPPKIPTDKLADAVTYPSPVYTHWMAPELRRMGE